MGDTSGFDLSTLTDMFGGGSGGKSSTDAAPQKEGGIVGWLKDFFSIHTLIRGTAIVVGVILIILSIAVLVGRSSAGQATVTKAVRKVAGPKAAGVASELADNVVEFAAAA